MFCAFFLFESPIWACEQPDRASRRYSGIGAVRVSENRRNWISLHFERFPGSLVAEVWLQI